MLNLHSTTSDEWLQQARSDLELLLVDHAHCEKKAASTAMNLMFAYVENRAVVDAMSEIVEEELDHFRQVLDLIDERGMRFRRLKPSSYGGRLHELVRKFEPDRAVDRLLVAGLIEARSCERFSLLRDHLDDAELAEFYGSLFASEARHHSTYVQLACEFAPEADVRARQEELAREEARILVDGDDVLRMHS